MPRPNIVSIPPQALYSLMTLLFFAARALSMPIRREAHEVDYLNIRDPNFPPTPFGSRAEIPLVGQNQTEVNLVSAVHAIIANDKSVNFFSDCFDFNKLVEVITPAVNQMAALLPVNYTEASCDAHASLIDGRDRETDFFAQVFGLDAQGCNIFQAGYNQTVDYCKDEWNSNLNIEFMSIILVGAVVCLLICGAPGIAGTSSRSRLTPGYNVINDAPPETNLEPSLEPKSSYGTDGPPRN